MIRLIVTTLLLVVTGTVNAQLNVVATTSNMGMLVDTVGGPHVATRVLAPPNRDTHYLDVRPNMMTALRGADLVVSVGAELEIGWLPPAIDGAANPRLQPGNSGYFEAAAQVQRVHNHVHADRSQGDVHPQGNPHVYLDPVRMGRIAVTLAERMADLDPDNAGTYRGNAERFRDQAQEHVARWQEQAHNAPGVVLYHEDADYLLERLGIAVLGFLEPVPGVPPTGSHLRRMVNELDGHDGVIIRYPYQSERHTGFLAGRLGWKVHELMPDVEVGGDADDYFALLQHWVDTIAR